MQIQTHILAGWCIANCRPLSARERLFAMIASEVADIDGLGLIFGKEYYLRFHHIWGHNLLVGLVVSFALAYYSQYFLRSFTLYLLLFHLHLLLDSFGSGIGWGIGYFWPFSTYSFINPYAWEFQGWQNMVVMFVFLTWATVLIKLKSRTPFEIILPALDQKFIRLMIGKEELTRH